MPGSGEGVYYAVSRLIRLVAAAVAGFINMLAVGERESLAWIWLPLCCMAIGIFR